MENVKMTNTQNSELLSVTEIGEMAREFYDPRVENGERWKGEKAKDMKRNLGNSERVRHSGNGRTTCW